MSLIKSNNRKGSTPALRSTLMNDPFFSDFMTPQWSMWNRLFGDSESRSDLTPAMNIKEDEKKIEIELAAPGLKKDDFQVTLENGLLTISAEKESKKEDEKEGLYRREFSYDSFSRSLRIPESVDEDSEIEAKYVEGILQLTLHKIENLEQKKLKHIKVS